MKDPRSRTIISEEKWFELPTFKCCLEDVLEEWHSITSDGRRYTPRYYEQGDIGEFASVIFFHPDEEQNEESLD